MPVDFLTEAQLARYGRYADEPSSIQLARYFYLDDTDHALITKRRGDHSRLGFALQICTARFLGTFLTDPTDVPAGVIVHLARQLSIADTACLTLYRMGKTHWEHAAEIRAAYGYQTFTAQPGHFHFMRWLYTRAWLGLDRPSILFDRSTAFLVARKVMLPGASVLERHIGQARDRANVRMWRLLAQATTPEHRTQLEGLLLIPDGERVSVLEQLRRSPTLQSSNGLLDGLERLAAVRALSLPQRTRSPIPANRIANLARFAMTARAQAIARMPTDRKIATLLAFVQRLEATANDDVLDVFDTFFTTLCIDARQAGIKERIRTIKDLDAAALQLATMGFNPARPERLQRTCVQRSCSCARVFYSTYSHVNFSGRYYLHSGAGSGASVGCASSQASPDCDPITPGLFGCVQCEICICNNLLHRLSMFGVRCHTKGERHTEILSGVLNDGFGACLADVVCPLGRQIWRDPWQHHQKLLTTIAADNIRTTGLFGDQAGDFDQNTIANRMPIGIIDRFEVINIH